MTPMKSQPAPPRSPRPKPRARDAGRVRADGGFTLVEAVVALGLTLAVAAGFMLLFRHGDALFLREPAFAAARQDARAILDHIERDLVRAGSGLPVEVPVFSSSGTAGDHDPDGLDFLAAPARMAEIASEPVMGFNGRDVTLAVPETRLPTPGAGTPDTWVVVFNDDAMTPRWAFGRVAGSSGSGGLSGVVSGLVDAATGDAGDDDDGPDPGATVTIEPVRDDWRFRFNSSVDGDTFEPGSGGGLVERTVQSLFGGLFESVLGPTLGGPAGSAVLDGVVSQALDVLKKAKRKKKGKLGSVGKAVSDDDDDEDERYGLFGLGQPGLVPVSRIRYWVEEPDDAAVDPRRVLMRRMDDAPAQPIGFVEDLQVRYVTGENVETLLDDPPDFIGDMSSSWALSDHVVRAVDVELRLRVADGRLTAGEAAGSDARLVSRTLRRRVSIRSTVAGVDRRAWKERLQMRALPTEIPRVGPLRYIPLP